MLNLKKVIALVCVFALALSTVAFGATYTDVAEDNAYYEAVETLNKLGIVTGYEDGTYKPEDGVTRAEMAALIARIQGYGETAKASANTAFTDVPASHWASGYIASAAGMGIINGYGDGTFGPDDQVLYEQAVKMVMATLGYTPFAEKNGGYPTGYLAAAQRYEVVAGVANAAVGQAANRGTVAQLLENAIDTPLMIQAGWNTNGQVEYKIAEGELVTEYVSETVTLPTYDADGEITGSVTQIVQTPVQVTKGYKTLMSENLGYVKIRGILYATDFESINSAPEIDTTEPAKAYIDVKDSYGTENKKFNANITEYLAGEIDVEDFLGRSVIAYVKANSKGEFELVSIAVDTNRNDELVIDLDQYAGINGNEVSYYKDGANSATKVLVESGFKGVFNGVGQETGAAALGMVDTKFGGQMTFIDNDDERGYDLVIVRRAATAVVDEVTEDGITFLNNCAIYGDDINEIVIDAEDETKVVKIMKDGKEIAAAELAQYDVLSVYAANATANYIVADVVSNKVVGTIASTKNSKTSAFPSETGLAYKVADAWYDVADGAYGTTDLGIGEGGTFYVDEFGKIAAFIEDSALANNVASNYGYILGKAVEKAAFGASAAELKVQILTANGVEILSVKNNARFELAEDVTLDIDLTEWDVQADGSVADRGNNDHNGATEWSSVDAVAGLVKFVKNSNGQITKVTVPGHDSDFAADADFVDEENEFDAVRSKFAEGGRVAKDALVFIIDEDNAYCRIGSLADFEDDGKYDITAAYTEKRDVAVLVTTYDSVNQNFGAAIAVIKEVGTSIANSEMIYSLVYLENGEEKSALSTADAYADNSNLAEGDIVKIKVGSDGIISNIEDIWTGVVRTNKGNTIANRVVGANNGIEEFFGGVVKAWDKEYKDVEIDAEGTVNDFAGTIAEAKNVYVIDNTGLNLVIKKGIVTNFKNFANLYKEGVTHVDLVFADATIEDKAVADAAAYADHIYIRTYDDEVVDVVIVKSALEKVVDATPAAQ